MQRPFFRLSAMALAWLLLASVCGIGRAQASAPCPPAKPVPAGATITVTMKNGDVARGVVLSSDGSSMKLNSASFGQIVISVCNIGGVEEATATPPPPPPGSISAPIAPAITSAAASPATPPKVQLHGLNALTISMGFTGSFSRDQSYSAAPSFYAYQPKAKGRTLLSLSASYDDKWKAAPNSSNVTQVYSGRLQQLFTVGSSGALVLVGSAYHNNSQGIIVDQAYGVGGAKTFAFPRGKNSYVETDFDIRAIHDAMNPPGPTVLLVGSNLSISYSKRFPAQASISPSIDFKAGVIPVFNRANSWQAYGNFDAFHPITAAWSVGLNAEDNYFEIAPKGFNKNYIKLGLSIKYTPQAGASAK